MESFQEEQGSTRPRTISLADRITRLEQRKTLAAREEETEEKTRNFRWPFKWRRKFNKVNKPVNSNKILVFFLNKKNEIEPPKFMPIFDGNMIVWGNKPYEFDPRAVWVVKGVKGNPRACIIKEIDRRPVRNKQNKLVYGNAAVSNMDIDEVRKRGDSTESDEFLIKAAIKAQTIQTPRKPINWVVVIIAIAVLGGIAWFMFGGG